MTGDRLRRAYVCAGSENCMSLIKCMRKRRVMFLQLVTLRNPMPVQPCAISRIPASVIAEQPARLRFRRPTTSFASTLSASSSTDAHADRFSVIICVHDCASTWRPLYVMFPHSDMSRFSSLRQCFASLARSLFSILLQLAMHRFLRSEQCDARLRKKGGEG